MLCSPFEREYEYHKEKLHISNGQGMRFDENGTPIWFSFEESQEVGTSSKSAKDPDSENEATSSIPEGKDDEKVK